MDNAHFEELSAWITEAGLAGQSETAILAGLCEREVARGLPLARALVLIDTLHPIYEGRAFRWTRAQKETTLTEYGRTDDDLSRWQRSPFYLGGRRGAPARSPPPPAASPARHSVTAVNQRRATKGLPITDIYLALHI